MKRCFTHYWTNSTWASAMNEEGQPLRHTAGNTFVQRGVREGDVVYVVTVLDGRLYLCGMMVVSLICGQKEAEASLGRKLWASGYHLIAEKCTVMRFDISIPQSVARRLRFVSAEGTLGLKYNSKGAIDQQTLRGVRELEGQSASVFDDYLGRVRTWPLGAKKHKTARINYAGDIENRTSFPEGATKVVTVNAYERSASGRKACLTHYGTNCSVCNLSFLNKYGNIGKGFIHVHHLVPLGRIRKKYRLNPIMDLRPVCPNCHAMLHVQDPPLSIDELRAKVRK